jgi:predicted dehydrogenase
MRTRGYRRYNSIVSGASGSGAGVYNKEGRGRAEKLKVVIVGAGAVSAYHMRAWRGYPYAEVVAICDVNRHLAWEQAKRWNISQTFANLAEALSVTRGALSVVDICTPPHTHLPLILQSLEAGCHVLVEKPLVLSSREAEELLARLPSGSPKLCVVHNWLFTPHILELQRLVEAGQVGDIVGMDVHWYIGPI